MVYETLGTLEEVDQNIAKALKMAEEDGYITTKTMSDILKPVNMSTNFIISESKWWSYEELNGNIQSIAEPGHVFVSFPQYHTSPKPDKEAIKMLKMMSDVVRKIISDDGEITTETLAGLFPSLFGEILISGPHFSFLDSEKCMDFICNYLNEKNIILPEYDKSKKTESFNLVSHPSHYTAGRKYEPRKVIADWGLNFNLGNAVKYVSRAGRKGDKIEDLQKAIQYIEFEIEELEDAKYE